MWTRTLIGANCEEFTPRGSIEGLLPGRIKFVVMRNTPRGEEYRFEIFGDLGCGEMHFILAIYSRGPYRHVYAVCGVALDPYERNCGIELAKRLCRALPADFQNDRGSSFWLEEAWEEAPDYLFDVVDGD